MSRFNYLEETNKKKKKKDSLKTTPAPDGRQKTAADDKAEAVYLRKSTIRAVWREYRKDGGESVSELVEDLLLKWLRDRA